MGCQCRKCLKMCGHGDPDGICVVSCDLGDAYPAGVRRNFGSAVVVYDRFHAVKLANEAMDDVVRRYMRDQRKLRGMHKMLMMNPSSLSCEEYDGLMKVVSDFKEVSECYRLKNVLASIYDYGEKDAASKVLDLWYDACIDSGIPDMARLAETIRSRREGILAWYDHPVSNGYAEGLNSLIQTTKRVARGYSNVENFIAMIYLRNGNLDISFDRRPGDHLYARAERAEQGESMGLAEAPRRRARPILPSTESSPSQVSISDIERCVRAREAAQDAPLQSITQILVDVLSTLLIQPRG